MPRTLPWLKNKTTTNPPQTSTPSTPAKHNRKTTNPPLSHHHHNNNSRTPHSRHPARTPSTSPPPRPPTPPSPLHPSDAKWRLVEDEFYSTAQLFTQHLHVEEYKRMKREARERIRNESSGVGYGERANGAVDIARGGAESELVEHGRRKRDGGRAGGSEEREEAEEDGEDMVIGDKNLKDLMFGMPSARGMGMRSKALRQAASGKANTKASMGYGNPSQQGLGAFHDDGEAPSEYDSDDLDAPVMRPVVKLEAREQARELPYSPPKRKYGADSSAKATGEDRQIAKRQLPPTVKGTHNGTDNPAEPAASNSKPRSPKPRSSERAVADAKLTGSIPSIFDDLSARRTRPVQRHRKKPGEQTANIIPTVFL